MLIWLASAHVVALHDNLVAVSGGEEGVLSFPLLHSAVARARNRFAYDEDADVFDLAAEYVFGIAANHAFLDANKRTAFASGATFVRLNGYRSKGRHKVAFDLILSCSQGNDRRRDVADFLRSTSR